MHHQPLNIIRHGTDGATFICIKLGGVAPFHDILDDPTFTYEEVLMALIGKGNCNSATIRMELQNMRIRGTFTGDGDSFVTSAENLAFPPCIIGRACDSVT